MKRLFKTELELQNKIDEYFCSLEPEYIYDKDGNMICDKNGVPVMTERKPATISSMAYFIGLTSKSELEKLSSERKYKDVLNRAFLRTEAYIERLLFDKSASSGAKYILEQCFGRENVNSDDNENNLSGVVLLSEVDGKNTNQ